MMAIRLLSVLLLAVATPGLAAAQDQSTDGTAQPDAENAPADPIESLQGIWRIDHVEGKGAADSMMGSLLPIDRQAIATLSGGTCTGPGFSAAKDPSAADQVRVDVTCLGQVLASATWSTFDPNSVAWVEPDAQVVLHRVAEASTTQPAASDATSGSDAGADSSGEDEGGAVQ